MTLYELALLGQRLREAQKQFFSDHTQSALAESKKLERMFDAAVLQVIGDHDSLIACQQLGLFEGGQSSGKKA
jgi:hypothetical protein